MLTKDSFPQALKTDLNVAYQEGRAESNAQEYRQLIEVVPTSSTAKTEVHYGNKPKLQRFRSERQPRKFNEYKQTITLDDWESTISVKRQVLDDDQSGGILRSKVVEFGRMIERSLKQETEEFLRKGVSVTSFDKTAFFNPAHVYTDSSGATHGTVWGNVHWGGSQLDATTMQLLKKHFAELKGDDDEVLGLMLTHVGVKRGSGNEKSAMELSNSQYTVETNTTKDNIFRGSFSIIPMDYGLGASEWFGFDLSQGDMKPVKVLSHVVSPGFDNMEYTQLLEDSDTGFWRNEFSFGVFGRFDWNPGDPRVAYLHGSSTFTGFGSDNERQRVIEANA